jgi:hypothetical protein
MLFRKADNNGSLLWDFVKKAHEGVATGTAYSGEFALEAAVVARLKQLLLTVLGAVVAAREHQEVLLAIADMIITLFALESVVLRADKVLAASSETRQNLLKAVVKVAAFELSDQFRSAASRCSAYALKGDALSDLQTTVSSLSACPVEDLLAAKHLLSQQSQESGKYFF